MGDSGRYGLLNFAVANPDPEISIAQKFVNFCESILTCDFGYRLMQL